MIRALFANVRPSLHFALLVVYLGAVLLVTACGTVLLMRLFGRQFVFPYEAPGAMLGSVGVGALFVALVDELIQPPAIWTAWLRTVVFGAVAAIVFRLFVALKFPEDFTWASVALFAAIGGAAFAVIEWAIDRETRKHGS